MATQINLGSINNLTPTLSGNTATAGATIAIAEIDAASAAVIQQFNVGALTADATGAWSYTLPTQTEGTHYYQVTATNPAGIATVTNYVTILDVTPPTATVQLTKVTEDTGVSATDFITSDNTLIMTATVQSGTVAPTDTVQLTTGDGVWHNMTAVAGQTGVYQYDATGTTLDNGAHQIQTRVVDAATNAGTVLSQTVTIIGNDAGPKDTTQIIGYFDNVGTQTGLFGSNTITDDRQPEIRGTVNNGVGGALSPNEQVAVFQNGAQVGLTTIDPTGHWSYTASLNDLSSNTFTAKVEDVAGNTGAVSNTLSIGVDLTVTVNFQQTIDTTPIITGTTGFTVGEGEYLEVTVNGKTYSSQNGAVSIDPTSSTWSLQIPDLDELLATGQYYDVQAVLKSSTGVVITSDNTTNELYITPPAAPNVPPGTLTIDNKATAMTIDEVGGWRLFANGTVMTSDGTNSTNVDHLSSNVLTTNKGVMGAATFVDFNRDGLMDIMGVDNYASDGQQAFLYAPGTTQVNIAGASKYAYNQDYVAFQVGNATAANTKSGLVQFSGTGNESANVYAANGSVSAYDKGGNGYVDLVIGANDPNDSSSGGGFDSGYLLNNNGYFMKDPSLVQSNKAGALQSGQSNPDKTSSTVDLNNDGRVDVVFGGNDGTNYLSAYGTRAKSSNDNRLVVASDNGTGAMEVVQIVDNMLLNKSGTAFDAPSMTWADFNGDGYLDLFQGVGYGTSTAQQNASRIYFNDGAGNLSVASTSLLGIGNGPGYNTYYMTDFMKGGGSVAVDWNGDGRMDIIEIPFYPGKYDDPTGTQYVMMYTNVTTGGRVAFQQTVLTGLPDLGAGSAITGVLSLDMDWDGDKDLLLFTGAAGTTYIENKSTIPDGTSLHVKILDQNGINSLFGNTVQLFDSHGVLVSTQIINPQSGSQTNDSSALVDFYGLNPTETYNLVLLRAVDSASGGSSQDVGGLSVFGTNTIENINPAWTGLQPGAANSAYVLTAEAGNAVNDANIGNGIIGTGYNDTFFATLGSDKYEGGGGTETISGAKLWSNTGGEDIVDYKLAGSTPVTVDLSITTIQKTGFGNGTTLFSHIEGINGGNGNDTFTDSSADNIFNGRGGNDTYNLIHGGHDTIVYEPQVASDPNGGNGSDTINGFSVGLYEAAPSADRIDVSKLLVGYTGNAAAPAHYINGVATIDPVDPVNTNGDIRDFLKVSNDNGNTTISIDRDGNGVTYGAAPLVTLTGVTVSLESLLANHQIVV